MEKSRAIELLEHLAWDRDIERNPYGDALNMAIEALKAQLSQEGHEGTTSDLISRQAAIDGVKILHEVAWENWHEPTLTAYGVIDMIRELPPAQPEYRLDEWCRDCKEYDQEHHCCPRFNRVIREALKDAQHESKEGHWIPHEGIDGDIQYECSECGVLWEFNYGTPEDNEAYFCPKCGAKMKGAEHETN